MKASAFLAATSVALTFAAAAHATPSHKYHWSKMSLAQTMTVQRSIIINDWRIITRWQASRWVKIDANNVKFVERPKPAFVTYAQNQMRWTQRERQERVALTKAAASRRPDAPPGLPPHASLWMCLLPHEGGYWSNQNTGGNGHWGGLQMHPDWGYGTSHHASDDSPSTQMWAAERGYKASGYSRAWLQGQWGQTIGPCWGYA